MPSLSSKVSLVLSPLALFLLLFVGCVTAPPKPVAPPPLVTPAAVPTPPVAPPVHVPGLIRLESAEYPAFSDDVDTDSLRDAALQSLTYYQQVPTDSLYVLGNDTYSVQDMEESMDFLLNLLESKPKTRDWLPIVISSYTVYQSRGTDADRTVTFSSYYEPTISARPTRSDKYRFPFYARPTDLVDVDLSKYDVGVPGGHISGRRQGRSLVPYATRGDIDDGRKILQHTGLEIAWAKDPMDVLDLQIEGSGWLDFGKHQYVRIRYDGDNGRKYKSVGQYLISTGRIPAAKFNRKTLWRYMERHPKERQELLNINERYVFFRIDTSTAAPYAYGNIDVPLTAGRSIATDPKVFPKGALTWIDTERSLVDKRDHVKGQKPLKRFMLNQDEGGAIQGPGRVDIFAGRGAAAKRLATHLWYKGKIYFLVKRKS